MRTENPSRPPNARFVEGRVHFVLSSDFTKFIDAPYAIIYAGTGATPARFSSRVKRMFGPSAMIPARLGVSNLSAVKWTPLRKLYAKIALDQIGMHPDYAGRPPSGYYVFADGLLIAHQTIQIDFEGDTDTLLIGGIAALFGLATDSPRVANTGMGIFTAQAERRLADSLFETVLKHRIARAQEVVAPNPPDELERAYALLGLKPDASDEEMKAAHKREVLKWHPDLFAEASLEYKNATRQMADINAARDLIENARTPK